MIIILGFFVSDGAEKVAGETGLEPAAFCVTGRRYNQLNYSPGVIMFNKYKDPACSRQG